MEDAGGCTQNKTSISLFTLSSPLATHAITYTGALMERCSSQEKATTMDGLDWLLNCVLERTV